jgi:SSS family solute:Na+ symporter
MYLIDWIFAAIPLLIVAGVGLYANRYVKSVADFMTGGRAAGRYLLAIAGNELQAGAAVFVAAFESISHSGFALGWWGWISVPFVMVVSITGFVIYRFRETRAMTLGQFFEIRYSKSFRLFAGFLGFFAGILNFGIIPVIGARCMVYFLGLPATLTIFSTTVPTYIPLMAFFMTVTLTVALSGGIITVMLTNCLEGILSQIIYLIVIAALLTIFSTTEINTVLADRPPGQSFLNPFDSLATKDFNLWYVLMGIFGGVYGTMAWQNASAYNSAGLSAHESRMGWILGRWRDMGKGALVTLLGICAITFLHHPDFAARVVGVNAELHRIADPQVREQMESPIAIAHLLPMGVRGLLCAALLMGIFGGDATHLHSWGGIFIQDVIVPLRKTPLGPQEHIRYLRLSILFVAIFAFIFGICFQQTQYINMWWSVTTAVFVAGAGSAIIGGLYWKKGTTAGAWSAVIVGAVLSLSGIAAEVIYPDFPFNGTQVGFFSNLLAIGVYVVVSLLTCREDFNLDKMLHRGPYAALQPAAGEVLTRATWWEKLVGIDEHFTWWDKLIAGGILGWSIFWLVVMIIGSIWNLFQPWPIGVWALFWNIVGIGIPVIIAFVIGIWFTWGGIKDIRALFARLRQEKINHLDDGTVVDHQNLDERAADPERSH